MLFVLLQEKQYLNFKYPVFIYKYKTTFNEKREVRQITYLLSFYKVCTCSRMF